jgi:hypothetical protein
MNERIKELARQAGFNDFPDDKNGVWITDGYWNEELERFAELVRQNEREQAEYGKLTVKFGERAKEYLEGAKKSWDTDDMAHRPNGLTIDDDIQEYKRPWVGLTEKEIFEADNAGQGLIEFARAIETKLKERNT